MAKQKKASIRSRNVRRQATPPLIIPTEPPSEQLSGVSRVNKEIAALIARKDPVLNSISKKSKPRVVKQKKGRLEAKLIKAAAKADQLEVKKAKAQNRGKEIKKRRADWDAINEKKAPHAETVEKMKIDDN